MSLRRNIPLGISGRAGVLGSVYAWTAHGQYIKLFYAHLASPGTRPQRNPGKAPGNLLPRCRKMRQHRQRYFHAGHRRPSPAVKWHHATRARIRFPQPGARQGRHAAKTRGQGQRRWQEAVPAEGHRPRGRARSRPAVRGRRHGLVAASRGLRRHPPKPAGIGLTPHRFLLRPSLRRRARGDRVGHRARTRRQRPR